MTDKHLCVKHTRRANRAVNNIEAVANYIDVVPPQERKRSCLCNSTVLHSNGASRVSEIYHSIYELKSFLTSVFSLLR